MGLQSKKIIAEKRPAKHSICFGDFNFFLLFVVINRRHLCGMDLNSTELMYAVRMNGSWNN